MIMLLMRQVKLARDPSSEPSTVSSDAHYDSHDSHDTVDDDDTKSQRRSSTEHHQHPVPVSYYEMPDSTAASLGAYVW